MNVIEFATGIILCINIYYLYKKTNEVSDEVKELILRGVMYSMAHIGGKSEEYVSLIGYLQTRNLLPLDIADKQGNIITDAFEICDVLKQHVSSNRCYKPF